MKFAISAIIFAVASAQNKAATADFSSLSFLDNKGAFAEAESAREKFLKRSMKLATERTIKVKGYFNARD